MKSVITLSLISIPSGLEAYEIESRVDKLYSLGYFYNPVNKDFYNPFLSRGLKETSVFNMDEQMIEDVHLLFEKENKHGLLSRDEIVEVNSKQLFNNTLSNILVLAPFLSLILLIASVIFLIFNFNLTSVVLIFFCDIIIKSWIVQNALGQSVRFSDFTSDFGSSYGNIISSLSLLLIPYIYYSLYVLTMSFWLPLIFIFIYMVIVWPYLRKYVIQDFNSRFFFFITLIDIDKYLNND